MTPDQPVSFLNEGVNICAALSIVIGRNAKIGEMVSIFDTNFHQVKPDDETKVGRVVIGDNVWICAGAMVLAGASIGNHSVIGAGSIVVGDIPPCSIAVGRPAQVTETFYAADNWVRK